MIKVSLRTVSVEERLGDWFDGLVVGACIE
jgi:hypothetical protein